RILAERMPGNTTSGSPNIEACLSLQHAHDRERHRHQGGLSILGQGEPLGRAFPDDLAELLTQSRVNLCKHLAGRGKCLGKRLAHADDLASLTRKNESCRHWLKLPSDSWRPHRQTLHPTHSCARADERSR